MLQWELKRGEKRARMRLAGHIALIGPEYILKEIHH
jgi:hypothetical protein